MGNLQLPDSFQRSYENFECYPQNLVQQTSYIGVLRAYTTRLDNAAPKLFTKKDAEIFVPFRDLLPTGQGMVGSNSLLVQNANLQSVRKAEYLQRCDAEGMARGSFDHRSKYIDSYGRAGDKEGSKMPLHVSPTMYLGLSFDRAHWRWSSASSLGDTHEHPSKSRERCSSEY